MNDPATTLLIFSKVMAGSNLIFFGSSMETVTGNPIE